MNTYSHTFESRHHAIHFSQALNLWGAKRNNGDTIAFREGKTVTLRPEFTSKDSMREFTYQLQAFL
jgi:hypothetical protein